MVNRLLIFFVAMLPLFSLTSCGDDDDDDAGEGLVGKWGVVEDPYYVYYILNADGTGENIVKTDEQDCKATFDWWADDEYIYATNAKAVYGFGPEDFDKNGELIAFDGGKTRYRLDGDVLWVNVDGDDMVPFTRM